MTVYNYTLTIEVEGPFVTQGLGSKSFGLDTSIAKDENGYPIIPGSLIKGNVRHTIEELLKLTQSSFLSEAELNYWFGAEATSNIPNCGLLQFAHSFTPCAPINSTAIVNRIKINSATGVTDKGALQVIETALGYGETAIFSGAIRCYKPLSETIVAAINKALEYIESLGAFKSVGFGKIIKAKLQESPLAPTPLQSIAFSNNYQCKLTFDRPVCFTGQSNGSNLFSSQQVMHGSILKGAVAHKITMLEQTNYNSLKNNLDKVIFRWFKPSHKGKRPQTIPLNLAHFANESAKVQFSTLTDIEPIAIIEKYKFAPEWQSDWKGAIYEKLAEVAPQYKQADTANTLVVKTAIEPFSDDNLLARNTAKDASLFSYNCIVHKSDNDEPLVWIGEIDLSLIEDETTKKEVANQLSHVLSSPILSLGKTKAATSTSELSPVSDKQVAFTEDESTIAIKLESDAYIELNLSNIAATQDLTSAYANAFRQISPELTLVTVFASQKLQGGDYLWHRYFNNEEESTYCPYLITEAGSVFIFKNSQQTRQTLQAWLNTGLPIVPNALGNKGASIPQWQINPFNQGNGFGEIAPLNKEEYSS